MKPLKISRLQNKDKLNVNYANITIGQYLSQQIILYVIIQFSFLLGR